MNKKKILYKDNTIYVNPLFLYQFFRNSYRLLPCQPYSLKILINTLRYTNSFARRTKKTNQEELGTYLH